MKFKLLVFCTVMISFIVGFQSNSLEASSIYEESLGTVNCFDDADPLQTLYDYYDCDKCEKKIGRAEGTMKTCTTKPIEL